MRETVLLRRVCASLLLPFDTRDSYIVDGSKARLEGYKTAEEEGCARPFGGIDSDSVTLATGKGKELICNLFCVGRILLK